LDLTYYKHVDSTPQKEMPQNPRQTEESKKNDLQKESYTSQDLSKKLIGMLSTKTQISKVSLFLKRNASTRKSTWKVGIPAYRILFPIFTI
jgi:hypothetical protein